MKKTTLFTLTVLAASSCWAFHLPKQPVKSYDCATCDQLSKEPLQDKWSISTQTLETKVSNLQKSYGFRKKVDGKTLAQGIVLPITAPEAIIRIVPLGNYDIPALHLLTNQNKMLTLEDASKHYTENGLFGNEQFSTHRQRLLVLKPELGAGDFLLQSDAPRANQSYLISVTEQGSSTYMEVSTDKLHYQYGQNLHAMIAIHEDLSDVSERDVSAVAIGPEGQEIPLDIRKVAKRQFEATATLDSEQNDRGENWYVEVTANIKVGDRKIPRNGHAAFSYTVPSASLTGVRKISSKPLSFIATVDVATASRYALQSVLYRKTAKGAILPVETSQRAQWLEPGKQIIQFTFDNSRQFAEDSLFIGYFRLTDYGQMSCVYQYTAPIKLSKLVE